MLNGNCHRNDYSDGDDDCDCGVDNGGDDGKNDINNNNSNNDITKCSDSDRAIIQCIILHIL